MYEADPGGWGTLERGLGIGVGHVDWEAPHDALLTFAEQLRSESVPLGDLLCEMISASSAVDTPALMPAVVDLLSEPMTAAESVGTLMLANIAASARDAEIDDGTLLRVMALAAVLVARFETFVAERSIHPAP
jgi:hypothetical protein